MMNKSNLLFTFTLSCRSQIFIVLCSELVPCPVSRPRVRGRHWGLCCRGHLCLASLSLSVRLLLQVQVVGALHQPRLQLLLDRLEAGSAARIHVPAIQHQLVSRQQKITSQGFCWSSKVWHYSQVSRAFVRFVHPVSWLEQRQQSLRPDPGVRHRPQRDQLPHQHAVTPHVGLGGVHLVITSVMMTSTKFQLYWLCFRKKDFEKEPQGSR